MTDVTRYNAPRGTTLSESANGELVLASDYDALRDECRTLLAGATAPEAEQQKPAAWMHDQPGRVDVIHDAVKGLLVRAQGVSPRGLYRPLDTAEHYTIPLYTTPQPAQDVAPLVEALAESADYVFRARTHKSAALYNKINDLLASSRQAPSIDSEGGSHD